MFVIICIIFSILGLYLLLMGLRGVVTKKPFVFSARNAFWIVALSFVPSIINPLRMLWDLDFDSSFALPLLFPLLMYPVLLAFLWRQMRGYQVLGITDDSFRQALTAVLKDLQLPFEERLSKLHLTTLNADLEANVSSWMGVANLRIKQREHQETLHRVADGLKHYFAGSHVSINMVTCVYYIILGVLVLVSGAIFFNFAWGRGHLW